MSWFHFCYGRRTMMHAGAGLQLLHNISSIFMLKCALCLLVLPRDILAARWEEFSVKWDVMLDGAVRSHWLCCWTSQIPASLAWRHLFRLDPCLSCAIFLSRRPPGESILLVFWIFLWLSFLWVKPYRDLADLNYYMVIDADRWAPTLQWSWRSSS